MGTSVMLALTSAVNPNNAGLAAIAF